MSASAEAEAALRRAADLPDAEIDLAETALALARFERPDAEIEGYRRHLAALAGDVAGEWTQAQPVATADMLARRIDALNRVLLERHGYRGDNLTYDDLRNANLMSVIDRRQGLPVALGILYIHAARAQGWRIDGLAFPGHFLVRLEHEAARGIVDPFHGGALRRTAELRELLKSTAGPNAELLPEHYAALTNRDILLRLHNNLKTRLVRADKLERAVDVIGQMLLVAPRHAPLWREAALCHAKLGNLRAAIGALETYIALAPGDGERRQAAGLLQELRARLN